jgi:hypothetical protein
MHHAALADGDAAGAPAPNAQPAAVTGSARWHGNFCDASSASEEALFGVFAGAFVKVLQ